MVGLSEPTAAAKKRAVKKRSEKGKKKSSATIKANDFVIIAWDDHHCYKGEPTANKQKLTVSKWNKHGPGAWRFALEQNDSAYYTSCIIFAGLI